MITLAFFIGLGLGLLVLVTRSYFRIEQGHVGVLTSFGAAKRGSDGKLLRFDPGLHRKRPWEEVHSVSLMEQNLDLSGEEGGRSAMAQDGTVLRFDSILRFVPLEEELDKFLFGLRAPLDHITGLFTCLLRNEIANFRGPTAPAVETGEAIARIGQEGGAGSYAVIRRERRELNQRIEQFCHSKIGDRYGVRFAAVDLTDVLPPDELMIALNAVMNAQTEANTLYARAESDCQQRVLAAHRSVAIARTRSAAVETEIVQLASYLEVLEKDGTLDHYLRRRTAEVLGESRAMFVKRGEG